MSENQEPLCFTCGHPTGDLLRLNCLPSGQVCPTCRDRLLEALPPIFPSEDAQLEGSRAVTEASEEAESAIQGPQATIKGPGQLLRGDGPNEPA